MHTARARSMEAPWVPTPIHAFGERVTVPQCTRLYSCMSCVCDCVPPYESVSPYPLVGATTTIHQQLSRKNSICIYMSRGINGPVCVITPPDATPNERSYLQPLVCTTNLTHRANLMRGCRTHQGIVTNHTTMHTETHTTNPTRRANLMRGLSDASVS